MHRYNKQPIEIGRLQRYAMDYFYAGGEEVPSRRTAERTEKVACIGAGPASLACAAELRQRGFQVTLFEGRALPGGLNTYGVAEYKLRPADSLREVEMIRSLGVEFRFGIEVGGEAAFAALEKEFDVIFLGVGLGAMNRMNIPGERHHSVVNALSFHRRLQDHRTPHRGQNGRSGRRGKHSHRCGARGTAPGRREVHLLYRRGEQQMSAFDFEYEHAKQEGIRFHWWTQPVAIRVSRTRAGLDSLECVRVEADTQGVPAAIPESQFKIVCDMVIPAIGQSPLLEFLHACRGLQLDQGRVR